MLSLSASGTVESKEMVRFFLVDRERKFLRERWLRASTSSIMAGFVLRVGFFLSVMNIEYCVCDLYLRHFMRSAKPVFLYLVLQSGKTGVFPFRYCVHI
jgi:hypothetical protein